MPHAHERPTRPGSPRAGFGVRPAPSGAAPAPDDIEDAWADSAGDSPGSRPPRAQRGPFTPDDRPADGSPAGRHRPAPGPARPRPDYRDDRDYAGPGDPGQPGQPLSPGALPRRPRPRQERLAGQAAGLADTGPRPHAEPPPPPPPRPGAEQIEQLLAAARQQVAEYAAAAAAEADQIRAGAAAEVEAIRARVAAEAERDASQIRAAAESYAAGLRTSAEFERASARAEAERDAARARAAGERERDDIVRAARREADDIRRREQFLLEQSEALRTRAESDLEVELADRRAEAERLEGVRLEVAQEATRKLVEEAERRAADAEKRAAEATAQAEQARRDAEADAKKEIADAHRKAELIIAQAKDDGKQILDGIDADADKRRSAVQKELDELTRQKNEVDEKLAQMRQLFAVGTFLDGGDG